MIFKAEQIIPQIVSRLVEVFHPSKIFLFGSHAWGQPRPDSDIDMLVVVDKSNLSPTRRAVKAYLSLKEIKAPVEIIVSTKEELGRYKDIKGSLTQKIFQQGRVLYG